MGLVAPTAARSTRIAAAVRPRIHCAAPQIAVALL